MKNTFYTLRASMRRAIALVVCCVCTVASVSAQSKVFENLKMPSKLLGKEINYNIYLPESYETSERTYPVLYLLHGYSDDNTSWTHYGEVKQIADKQIASGESTEMIIVMPDGGVSWYMNSADGSMPYEDVFVKELIPYIEANYKARSSKTARAIAGLSMGGYGSIHLSLRNPDLFIATCPLSAAIWNSDQMANMPEGQYAGYFDKLYGGTKQPGNGRLTPTWKQYSVFDLVDTMPAEDLRKVAIYLDCGDDDFVYDGNVLFWSLLRKKGVRGELLIRNGNHNWPFWRSALPNVLNTVSGHFHRQ